jgi:uncharacterized membrane protein
MYRLLLCIHSEVEEIIHRVPQILFAPKIAFLLGFVDGLRSLTAPAIVCWAAHLGWLHFAGTKFAFIDHRFTLMAFTLLAIIELVVDKLPNTPERTAPVGLLARIVLGGASGLALAIGAGISVSLAGVIASIGAIAGAFAGYHIRRAVVFKAHLPDLVAAIAEDAVTIAGGLLIVSHA